MSRATVLEILRFLYELANMVFMFAIAFWVMDELTGIDDNDNK